MTTVLHIIRRAVAGNRFAIGHPRTAPALAVAVAVALIGFGFGTGTGIFPAYR